ncbi:MAG TPA: glycosyltransferase, partial [Acidobacteriota bacterium]|nr:glycosyltransferase [Acidobacteriota bacterium]
APFRIARGIQSKMLEAMAMERPVVGTPIAFQGLAAGREDGVSVADGVEAFAADVAALLQDGDARLARGRAARRFVERHHRWEDQGRRLEEILLGLQGDPARPAPAVARGAEGAR